MTGLAAVVVIFAGLVPTLVGVLRGDPLDRFLALQMMTVVVIGVLLLLADAFARASYVDVGLVLAVLSFTASLVFARFLGRSL